MVPAPPSENSTNSQVTVAASADAAQRARKMASTIQQMRMLYLPRIGQLVATTCRGLFARPLPCDICTWKTSGQITEFRLTRFEPWRRMKRWRAQVAITVPFCR
jgi:hypothetical protein